MAVYDNIDFIPLWLLLVITFFVVLASMEVGYQLGWWRRHRTDQEKETPVGAAVAAALGLLAFLVSFTFGMSATRFETRREVLLDEVNALGTTNLRAGMMPEPHRATIRRLLLEYIEIQLSAVTHGGIEEGNRLSEEVHARLWAETVAVAEKDPRSIPTGLFIQSVNEVIDLHSKRVGTARRNRIPRTIWVCLFLVSILSLGAMGYQGGLTGTCRSPTAIAVALSFAVVIGLIADLDRPHHGSIRVSQQPMIELRDSMLSQAR